MFKTNLKLRKENKDLYSKLATTEALLASVTKDRDNYVRWYNELNDRFEERIMDHKIKTYERLLDLPQMPPWSKL